MTFTGQMIKAVASNLAPPASTLPNGLPLPPVAPVITTPSFSSGSSKPVSDFETTAEATVAKFLLIIGPPFTGKTTACTTFDNPVFMNLDNKLPAGVQCVPFHKPAFCDKYAPRPNTNLPPNRRDAVLQWLYTRGSTLDPNLTLILDSFSALSDAFHLQSELVEDVGTSKAGNKALLKVFGAKLNYLESVFTLLKMLPCRVVVTAHTMPEYNDKGEPTGGVKPFCSGSFSDKIAGYATDIFRSYIQIDGQTGKPAVDPKTGEMIGYRWYLRPDRTCQFTNTLIKLPPGTSSIRARWQDLQALIATQDFASAPASEPAAEQTK